MRLDLSELWVFGLLVVLATIIGAATSAILLKIFARLAERTKYKLDDIIIKHMRRPVQYLLPVLLVYPLLGIATLPIDQEETISGILKVLTVMLLAWLATCAVRVVEEGVLRHFDASVKDNLTARRVHTQIKLFRQVVLLIIMIITASVILMMFDQLRVIGVSLLASAGIAGMILGFSAQKVLGNLLAGIQIAITQPIRLGDVLIVENEWGWVEEITLTYVVVKIWDLRRLVIPISHFLEKPFQNWTRTSADILGTVFIYADYTIPIDKLREELTRILQATDLWDGKVNGLQVTDAKEHTLELRALMSAADSPKAWDLRCLVREKLVTFVQEHYPQCLPKFRTELKQH
ncbi:MAG: mechanosensitive ion channel domain-containing protein [Nitrospirota bacterium]|nr:mechanosensitive ion channel domain-containing protein [Nitrospirota bacterium]